MGKWEFYTDVYNERLSFEAWGRKDGERETPIFNKLFNYYPLVFFFLNKIDTSIYIDNYASSYKFERSFNDDLTCLLSNFEDF